MSTDNPATAYTVCTICCQGTAAPHNHNHNQGDPCVVIQVALSAQFRGTEVGT